jgi:probable F420-dependent oxidoreductase
MDYGVCLPNFSDGASPEGVAAAAEAAERLGWSTVWTTDHVLVPRDSAQDYGHIYDAILTLAWVGARHPALRLATSVIVVPQRNAVVLAKEIASLDSLTGGRVIAGVGVGWNRTEFANLAMEERFGVRGAYLDETIRLWRHLWSGSTDPFVGRFHSMEDFAFGPLPAQGAALPIVVGGRAQRALERAGTLGDGYHSSVSSPAQYGERLPVIRSAAEAAGRPMPWLSARVRVEFDAASTGYAMRGSPEAMAAEVRKFADLGVTHLALWFGSTEPAELVARAERFAGEVAPLFEDAGPD